MTNFAEMQAQQAITRPASNSLESAQEIDNQIVTIAGEMYKLWFRMAKTLEPFLELQLYKKLGYTSFKDYTTKRLNTPVTSVQNWIYPYRQLKLAGLTDEQIEQVGDIPYSRVTELAEIIRAKGNTFNSDEWNKYVELARKVSSRKDSAEFKEVIANERRVLGLDKKAFIRVPCDNSLHELFKSCIDIQRDIENINDRGNPYKPKYSDAELLEQILTYYLTSSEVQSYIRKSRPIDIEYKEIEDRG